MVAPISRHSDRCCSPIRLCEVYVVETEFQQQEDETDEADAQLRKPLQALDLIKQMRGV
jgi:hypothetical protein